MVVESTGVFRDPEGQAKHLTAGAKKVVISAPAKGGIKTVVLGVNDDILSDDDVILSNASCTTNCLARWPKCSTTTSAWRRATSPRSMPTSDRRIQDAPHSDLRRARAAAMSMIPTTTGAAAAVGLSPRAQRQTRRTRGAGSDPDRILTDLVATLSREVTAEEVNAAMKAAAEGPMKGILEYTEDPIVSADIVGNPHSNILDAGMTSAMGNMVKVFGWYDNEMGYSSRVADLVQRIG